MSTLIDHAEKIRAHVDVSEVVGRYVELRRAGINLKGLCPFHREKTPSFTVNPAKGIFHCFGCGEGGDVVKFVQKIEHLEWVEALRLLSEQYSLPMPERESGPSAGQREKIKDERERLLAVSKLAAQNFHSRLLDAMKNPSTEAAQYLSRRKIDIDAVRQFEIGLAADAWQGLLDSARTAGFEQETVITAGVAIRNPEKNRVYDRFRKRLMFPVHDSVGRPIAFGGRVFASDASPEEPKYINSPETSLYRKGQQLYALHLAKESIMKGRRALLMEGYMDVIRAHRCGFPQAVATCGTALTDEQARELRRYADEVIFVYDGDAAGQQAMLRGTEILLDHNFTVRVLPLPGEHDPDSFLLKEGSEAFAKAITEAVPFLDFFLDAAAARYGRTSPESKVKILEEIQPLLRRIRNLIAASEYTRRTADYLVVEPSVLLAQLNKTPAKAQQGLRESIVALQKPQELPGLRDRLFLRLLIESDHARSCIFEQVEVSWISDERVRRLYAYMTHLEPGTNISYDMLMDTAETEEDRGLLRALALEDEPLDETQRTIDHLIARLKMHSIRERGKNIRRNVVQMTTATVIDIQTGEETPGERSSRPLEQQFDESTRGHVQVGNKLFLKPNVPSNDH